MILTGKRESVCPMANAGMLTGWLRRRVHNPARILSGLVKPGDTVMDIGCGPGLFSTQMAKMVGSQGLVFAIDLQKEMVELARTNARRAGVDSRMMFHQCGRNNLGLTDRADFILIFWVLHEIPDKDKLFSQIYNGLNDSGAILISEPLFHVRKREFMEIHDLAVRHGFDVEACTGIPLGRSVILRKRSG